MIKLVASVFILTGIVDQINADSATIEYRSDEGIQYTTVKISESDCVPDEGSQVKFILDEKILFCKDR